jgi:catalase (peroxidase I)
LDGFWPRHHFKNLFENEWELTKSPAGAKQWKAKGPEATIPDAHDNHVPTTLTTDLSLRFDPAYEKISSRFYENPDQFADAVARAWFDHPSRHGSDRAWLVVAEHRGCGQAHRIQDRRERVRGTKAISRRL